MRVIIIISIMVIFFGCKTKTKLKNIETELTLVINQDIAFNRQFDTRRIFSLNEKFPEYYNKQLELSKFKKDDSIIISTLYTDYRKFYFEMYQKGYLNRDEFIKKNIDSTIEIKKPEQKLLLTAIKFTKTKQVIIVDDNNNSDFSDDNPIYFDNNFRIDADDSLAIRNIPLINFNYWNFKDSQINNFKRKAIVYPSLNDYQFSYSNNDILKKSRLIIKLKDYWSGSLEVDKQKYNIAIQGYYNSWLTVLIKPDSLKFNKNDFTVNGNFEYRIKDSIKLANKIYVIDSITNNVSKLILRVTNKKEIYGFRTGQTINNLKIVDLNGDETKLYIFSKNKKYTLLDFWGTWCKPCKDAIPELKSFYSKNAKNVNLLSISYDKEVTKVKDFVHENDMKWNHFFVKRSRMGAGIIRDLNIKYYPTLILIDSNNKIVYRGSGTSALKEINDIILNN
ncbi:TlpA disulfide reductase family protein [Polaribacter sp. HaHaR_3_91]|uniref:TlpA family protein disulfide reductase n=1 Tax=Polaribacter sp. HaHaR_3_91 TaxID=2745561 RepID=UPI001C4EC182|nr:TlpA disulfide reductase family protein [Polaribacter sp. HaHaR_3_91]QXP63999.1 TlpA family protein disulfide reductase [Polaribacter sp. HaHaR_3_91]